MIIINNQLVTILISIIAIFTIACQTSPAKKIETPDNSTQNIQVQKSKNTDKKSIEFVIKKNDNSTARYIVNEQLVKLPSPNDAIGSTKEIEGKIVLSENGQISSDFNSFFDVNMLSLKSDSTRRDNYLKRNSLESNKFPIASFNITKINNLPFPAPTNQNLDFEIVGILTIRDISKEITWDVSGKFDGTKLTGLAKTEFNFGFFEIDIPKVFVVVSVKDLIQLEIEFEAIKVN
ncbi:MAG: YceI family protein [SAR202 cluster bacterium]|nr:YceI family protein [SAR202 cluster bacterium]|tara:strand:+ start:58104 stop:58805 length:702 start_codon:yes stop_codon:yes gene_type:complete